MERLLTRAAAAERLGVSRNMVKRHGIGALSEIEIERMDKEPPLWLARLRARRARKAAIVRIPVSCCVCGHTREVRPALVRRYTHLVCGACNRTGARPVSEVRDGMILEHHYDVAGFFHGYVYRIATAEERTSVQRARALAELAAEHVPEERQ